MPLLAAVLGIAAAACDSPTFTPVTGAEADACESGLDEDLDGFTDAYDIDCWSPGRVGSRACPVVAGTGTYDAPTPVLDDPGAWLGDGVVLAEDPLGELDGPVLQVPADGVARLDVTFTGAVPGTRLVGVLAAGAPTTRVSLVAVDAEGAGDPPFVQAVLEPDRIVYPQPGRVRAFEDSGLPPPWPDRPRPFELDVGALVVAARRDDRSLFEVRTFVQRIDEGFVDFDDLATLELVVEVGPGDGAARIAGLALHRPPGPTCPGVDAPPVVSDARPGRVATLAIDGRVTCALVDRGEGVLEPWRSDDGGRRYAAGAPTDVGAEVRGVALAPRCAGGFDGLAWIAGDAPGDDAWVPIASDDCETLDVGAPRPAPTAPEGAWLPGLSASRPAVASCAGEEAPLRVTVPQTCEGAPAVADFALSADGLEPVAACQVLEAVAPLEAFVDNPGTAPAPPFTGAPLHTVRVAGGTLFVGPSATAPGALALFRELAPPVADRSRARFRAAGRGVADAYAALRGVPFGPSTRLLVPVLDPWIAPSGRAGTVVERAVVDARLAFAPVTPRLGASAPASPPPPWGAALYAGGTACPACPSTWASALLRLAP